VTGKPAVLAIALRFLSSARPQGLTRVIIKNGQPQAAIFVPAGLMFRACCITCVAASAKRKQNFAKRKKISRKNK